MTKIYYSTILFFIIFSTQTLFGQTEVIAHRGFWKTNESAQNSIAALIKADSLNIYGSEVDIWLSADGVAVVNHDATVHLDGENLSVQDTPLETLRKVKLSNGEALPTFDEYLNAFEKCKNIKLIIEFKNHKSAERENILAANVINMVRERGLEDRVEYISFGINFVNQVLKLDPKAKVYYLNGDLTPEGISALGAAGIDYNLNVFYKHPEWVGAAQRMGQKVNVWTVNKPEDIQKMIDAKVDYITTDEPVLVHEMLNN